MFSIFSQLKAAKALPPPRKLFACPGCTSSFSNKGSRACHLKAKPLHNVRPTASHPYQCEQCMKIFKDQPSLGTHIVRFHLKDKSGPEQLTIEDKSGPEHREGRFPQLIPPAHPPSL